MLRYLKIFSWFLFTFGIVGAAALMLGYQPGITVGTDSVGLMLTQVVVSGLVLGGFRLNSRGVISTEMLLYGGWAVIIGFILLGQVWINR